MTLETGRGKHRKFLPYAFTEQGVAAERGDLSSRKLGRGTCHYPEFPQPHGVHPLDSTPNALWGCVLDDFKAFTRDPGTVLFLDLYGLIRDAVEAAEHDERLKTWAEALQARYAGISLRRAGVGA